jgi:hypothetical protein
MTFAVIDISENREKVVGTIWASGETEAQQVASSLFHDKAPSEEERHIVRRADEREIPLRELLA